MDRSQELAKDLAPATPAASAPLATVSWVRTNGLLLSVSALTLILRLFVMRFHPIDHNGAWFLFIARNFAREYTTLAHPPLFVLLLKACDSVSHSLFAYRFFPLLASAASVFLVGRTLQKLQTLPSVAALGALAFGCAQTSVVVSFAVEGYTLCVFFVLVAFFYLLDIARASPSPPRRSRLLFSTFTCLALLSHYFAALFVAACGVVQLAAAISFRRYRPTPGGKRHDRWLADLLTFLPPAVVSGTLYVLLVRPWFNLNRATFVSYYFRPAYETLSTFLIRNLRETFNLFAPVALSRARFALPLFALLLGSLVWAPARERRSQTDGPDRLLPALFLIVLLVIGMILGLLGRYPFGGEMRHQFLLFVFAVLAGFVALDRLLRAVGFRWRQTLVAICLISIGASGIANRTALVVPAYREQALVARSGIFRQNLEGAGVVHVDQFNLIGMVMDYYTWPWRFAGQNHENPSVQRYELTRGGERLTVIAHRDIWLMDFRSASLYPKLRASFEMNSSRCQTAFCVYRNLYGPPWLRLPEQERAGLLARVPALATAAGMNISDLRLSDDAIGATFCIARTP